MKQIIVLVSLVLLGCYIANLVAGSDGNSVKSSLTNVWKYEIEQQNTYP